MNVAQLPSIALAPAAPLGLLAPGARFVIPLDRRADFAGSPVAPIESPHVFTVLRQTPGSWLVAVHPADTGPVHHLPAATLVRPIIGQPGHRAWHGPSARAADRRESAEDDAYEAERNLMQTGSPSLAAELDADRRSATRWTA